MKHFRHPRRQRRRSWENIVTMIKEYFSHVDKTLLFLVLGLTAFGLVVLSSASSVRSYTEYNDAYYIFWHQVQTGLIPGMILFLFFVRFNYRTLERWTVYLYGAAIFLLLLVFVPGIGTIVNGSRSWVTIGFQFQPAEIVKLLLILSLAGWLAYRGEERNRDFWNGVVPFLGIIGLIAVLILLQPDLGTLIVIAAIAGSMYFVAGARWPHLVGMGALGLAVFAVMVKIAPYRAARLLTFLHPELDPLGTGYHIGQAFIAVGSGGLLGLGLGQSRQKFAYLPEVVGDSIFAVMAEELGFFIVTAFIITVVWLSWHALKVALSASDDYGRFIAVGISAWFFFQAAFNMGAMVGLLPLTGIPLPFVSQGGTALAMSLGAAGILLNISRHTPKVQ